MNKKKCVNYENNHSIWSFQCKIRVVEKSKISNIWRTKSILHSINFEITQQIILDRFDVDVQQTLNREKIISSTTFFCFSIKKVLTKKKKKTALKNIMYLKTRNYFVNEIISKRILSQDSKRSMSSLSRQLSINVMQMISNSINNAFDVLKNRSNIRAF